MKELSRDYINSLYVGIEFARGYSFNDATSDWTASNECATIAKLCIDIMKVLEVPAPQLVPLIVNSAIANGFIISDHGWDDFTRGFIAGEVLGCQSIVNELDMFAIVEEAEEIWEDDCGSKYGYYQDVVNEAVKNWRGLR